MPKAGEFLWQWFMELHATRGSSGWGPSRITYQDLFFWSLLTGVHLTPSDVRVLRTLDSVYMAHYVKNRPKKDK